MSKVGASTTVNVVSGDAGGGGSSVPLLVMERAAKEGTPTEKYFRVHTLEAYTLRPSTGSVNKAGDGIKNCIEYLSFSNSQVSGLRYPNAVGVALDVIGNILALDGSSLAAFYDPVRRAVVLPKPGYGIVKVTYQSHYDMWRATFGRASGA